MLYFADTSALLNGCAKEYEKIWISPLVVSELENIKTSLTKDEHIKYLARQLVRDILFNVKYENFKPSQRKIDSFIKHHPTLSNINDHRILAAAYLLQVQTGENVTFLTSDGSLYLLAWGVGIETVYYQPKEEKKEEYCGWNKFVPNEEQLISLYTDPTINILNANINEYCEIFENDELKDVLRWTGEKYTSLKYNSFKNNFLNKKIQPYNLEQKMAFDLLQNSDIAVKVLVGPPGTGKDYLMLLHALDLIQKGVMDKIIFVRNLVPFKDAPEIGFLAGDLQQKISWGLGPISSILGEEGLAEYEEQGLIEAVNLGFIRGCSWDKTIIYVSEGQNITGGGYKLLVSRCGQGSQLWVNGDILQTDNKEFEKNNGLFRLCNSLKDNKLAGMVKLLKTERSEVADLAKVI